MAALSLSEAAEARGGICEKARRPGARKPRCGRGGKVCGGDCVPTASVCCRGTGYDQCPDNRTFSCAAAGGQCCNNGGQCGAATPSC